MHKSVKIAFFWIITLFIGLFVATYVTIQYANRDPIQVIEKNYYEKGLNYEKEIRDQKEMIAEGYRITGNIFSDGYYLKKGKNPVSIAFYLKNTIVPDSVISLQIERGATDRFNKSVSLQKNSSGEFVGEIDIAFEGPWVITATAVTNGKSFVKSSRIYAE